MKKEKFEYKKINFNKLIKFGFKRNNEIYEYFEKFSDEEFTFHAIVNKEGEFYSEIIDNTSKELYTLHLLPDANGEFVGKIKNSYENILNRISTECCDESIFKSKYTYELIQYAYDKYSDSPEYLWKRFPNNAILRRKDSKKWYAAILTVNKNKLGFDENKEVEVVDIHAKAQDIPELVKTKNIYPGYHMNKKHWITVILDGSMPMDQVFKLIDKSYDLACKN